jgi:20S proteasome alpha/beta subunit
VTICAAAINQTSESPHCIIAVCDRKLSVGQISAEGIAWKVQTIHPKWKVMGAGPTSPLVALTDAVKVAVASAKYENLRSFARLCSRAYREERQHIIETDILSEHDVNSYSEYQTLKSQDRTFFDALTAEIKKAEQEWNLLFLGFDKVDRPHLFVITEYGKIQYCDMEGFAAIGSGAWAFWAALSQFGFNRNIPRGQAMYGMLAAKFAAESAEGVGRQTVFMIVKPSDRLERMVPGLLPKDIKEVRAGWQELPRIPTGMAGKIEGWVRETEAEPPLRVANPLKGYVKRVRPRNKKPRP